MCGKVICRQLTRRIEFALLPVPYGMLTDEAEAVLNSRTVLSTHDIVGIGVGLLVFAVIPFVPTTQPEPPNAVPHIETIHASQTSVYARDSCTLVCQAGDADGDDLAYAWSATDGEMKPLRARAQWTAPVAPGKYALTVEVRDDKGGADTTSMIIEVRQNEAPTIDGVQCETAVLLPGEATTLTCVAHDPDGHELAYEWSCTSGELVSVASEAVWTAPQAPGAYLVTARISDGYGGTKVQSVLLDVLSPEPPTIHQMSIFPLLPEYSKESSQGFRLLRGSLCECEIECIATAGGKDLVYEWTTSAGSIHGEGPTALFVPPAKRAEVVVSVIVTDILQQSDHAEVFFDVFNREAYAERDDSEIGCVSCRRR